MSNSAKFDYLAANYDRYRPRYPSQLLDSALGSRRDHLVVVDAGAGTGLSLEWILPALQDPKVHAIDISSGMVRVGQQKFPRVNWHVGSVEQVLASLNDVDLIVAGQSYQWFDRPSFLESAKQSLRKGGRLVVVQNNRDHIHSSFLLAYEELLEEKSPGYNRNYRKIDVTEEIAHGFSVSCGAVHSYEVVWEQQMFVDEFVGMSSSSTQVQRAVTSRGDTFLTDVRQLAESYASAGVVEVAYRTEMFVVEAP